MRLLKAIHSQKTERGRRGGSKRETTESENRDITQERSINLQLEEKKRRDLSDRKQNKEKIHRRRSEDALPGRGIEAAGKYQTM